MTPKSGFPLTTHRLGVRLFSLFEEYETGLMSAMQELAGLPDSAESAKMISSPRYYLTNLRQRRFQSPH
jgi:hypothetical protein